jgi:hypothetical protein
VLPACAALNAKSRAGLPAESCRPGEAFQGTGDDGQLIAPRVLLAAVMGWVPPVGGNPYSCADPAQPIPHRPLLFTVMFDVTNNFPREDVSVRLMPWLRLLLIVIPPSSQTVEPPTANKPLPWLSLIVVFDSLRLESA